MWTYVAHKTPEQKYSTRQGPKDIKKGVKSSEEWVQLVSPASQGDFGSSSPWTTVASFRKAKALCGALWLVLLHSLPLTCSFTCLGTIIAFLKEMHWRALGREDSYKVHLVSPTWSYIMPSLGCLSATPPVLGKSQVPGSGEPWPVPGQWWPAESRMNFKLSARAVHRPTSKGRITHPWDCLGYTLTGGRTYLHCPTVLTVSSSEGVSQCLLQEPSPLLPSTHGQSPGQAPGSAWRRTACWQRKSLWDSHYF